MTRGRACGGHKSPAKKVGKNLKDIIVGATNDAKVDTDNDEKHDDTTIQEPVDEEDFFTASILIGMGDTNQVMHKKDSTIRSVMKRLLSNWNSYQIMDLLPKCVQKWKLKGYSKEQITFNRMQLCQIIERVQWMLSKVKTSADCEDYTGPYSQSFTLPMQTWFAFNPDFAPRFIPEVRDAILKSQHRNKLSENVKANGFLFVTFKKMEKQYNKAMWEFICNGEIPVSLDNQ